LKFGDSGETNEEDRQRQQNQECIAKAVGAGWYVMVGVVVEQPGLGGLELAL